ncbi:MAG: hypothetical protein EGS63_00925 [Lachnospira sp.]|nr:hypothetical protein [Lachnospira sp.]
MKCIRYGGIYGQENNSISIMHNKDRMKTMLVTPFMSCSARLPIYILFSQMFFSFKVPENISSSSFVKGLKL